MNIINEALQRGDNKVIVGATGPGKVKKIESLVTCIDRGQSGGCVSVASANEIEGRARLADVTVTDCPELTIQKKS